MNASSPALPSASTATMPRRKGLLFILSSPSGAGKTTLSRMLRQHESELDVSVSCTTRPPRAAEQEGKDYIFLTSEEFKRRRDEGGFLESAKVFGHDYGTPKAFVMERLQAGRDVLFDIDWQGTQQLMEALPGDVVRVFLLPPSADELAARLARRAQDDDATIARRMAKAPNEISHYAEYEYIIINHEIEESLAQLRAILSAERLKRERMPGLSDFTSDLVRHIEKAKATH